MANKTPSSTRSTKSGGDLSTLEVIDRLEVEKPRVEPNMVITPYTVVKGKKRDTTELCYRFEEDVFDPDDPSDLNLASMMTAQVALNYGMFCREIAFQGPLDEVDRHFIMDMMRNTAREIYVHKFLYPNRFLNGEAPNLDPIKLDTYVQAQVTFPAGAESSRSRTAPTNKPDWPIQQNRHAVLSSGGKDSLLTFGILRQLGVETHPVFVNESGRHWFTALNAYRHFKEAHPNTTRVWTNSDRVFSWMLRHLPFIRPNFAEVRSDEYPIRLWTVAVFLFGALPLAKKRGLGRMVVGDEYDTTQTLTHKGIKHHNAVFDQSRLFDHAMSRYFRRKGWGVGQFSILRPLSEILIEKTLAEAYPDLLALQMSCHATHAENGRILPCGNCEKCRRIVSMLAALEVSPSKCGYTEAQIDKCLREVATKGVHQEKPSVEHLAFLLRQQGVLASETLGAIKGVSRPEVMQLRFDPERSPMEAIPVDLRRPILELLLGYANGSVKKKGRLWIEYDPLADETGMSLPYAFESATTASHGNPVDNPTDVATEGFLLGELTWPEAKKRFAETDLALLPVGSIEQHGPHLPLDTDAFDADLLAKEVAKQCTVPKPIVLPLVSYGVAYHHEDFSGTVSISPDTLSKLVYEIGMAVARQGVTKLVIINGHGGNAPALKFAAQLVNRDAHIFTTVDTGETSDADIAAIVETQSDVHAGEIETSTALAVRPHLVRLGEATPWVPEFSSRYLDFSSKRSVEWYARTAKISPSGVMGDPLKASSEKGKQIWEVMIRNLVDFVEHLKGMTLDEIFQRIY